MRGTKSPIDEVRSILCLSFRSGDAFGGVKQIVARYPANTMAVASTIEPGCIMVVMAEKRKEKQSLQERAYDLGIGTYIELYLG